MLDWLPLLRHTLIGLLLMVLSACGDPATSFSEILEKGVKDGLPGISMYVRMGEKTWTGAAGLADITAGKEMSSDDRFLAVGSTQPWIATTILQLADEGSIALDDSLTSIIGLQPLYKVPGAQSITIRQALMQTTGFHNHYGFLGFLNDVIGPDIDPNRVRESSTPLTFFNLRGYRPLSSPGEQANFSASNATILGMIIEAVEDRPLNDVLYERIFKSVDINTGITAFGGPEPTVHNYIDLRKALVDIGQAAIPVEGRDKFFDISNINNSWAWAAGGMVVNAEELAALLDGLIKGQILDDQIVAAMIDTTVAQKNPDDENGPAFGLGLMHRGMKPSVHAYGHDGEALGYASLVYHIPTFDLTIAILSNGSGHELKLFNIFQQVFSLVDVSGQTLF